jgi:hypothetical protein
VVVAIYGTFANPTSVGCWGWWRLSKPWLPPDLQERFNQKLCGVKGKPPCCGPGSGGRGCCRFSKPAIAWAYDEFAFDHTEDPERIRQCANHFVGRFGVAYYYPRNGTWPFAHRPKGVGQVGLLELYNGSRQIMSTGLYDKWRKRYRKKFGAMVAIGAPGPDAKVYQAVLEICKRNKYVGIYAPSSQKATAKRRRGLVFQALDACTR